MTLFNLVVFLSALVAFAAVAADANRIAGHTRFGFFTVKSGPDDPRRFTMVGLALGPLCVLATRFDQSVVFGLSLGAPGLIVAFGGPLERPSIILTREKVRLGAGPISLTFWRR